MVEVGSLSAKLTLDRKEFSAGLTTAKGELGSFASDMEGKFSKMGNALGTALKIGAAAGVAALAGVTAAATAGTKAFMEYEKNLANIGKVSGMSDRELQDFGKTVRAMAIETGTGVSALQELAASLSSAGVANQDLAPNLKLANQMMVALGTDATKTGGFIGGLSKAMGFSTDQIKSYASGLNVIENASRATSAYTMDFTEAMIPLGAMFKLDEKALLSFAAVAADAGLQASETATSIGSAVGIAMADPDKMASWAELLNTDVETLKQTMDRDMMGVLKKSAAALGKITSSTEKATLANEIWGRYGMKSLGSLTGALGNYDDYYAKVVADVNAGSQSMGSEQERVMGTLANMFDRSKAAINDFGITIGEVTQGPLKEFLNWFLESAPTISTALQQALGGDFFGAFKTMRPVLDDISTGIQDAMKRLQAFMSSIDFNAIFEQVQAKLGSMNWGGMMAQMYTQLGNVGTEIVNILGKGLTGLLNYDWEQYFDKVYPAVKSAFAKVGDAILSQPWGSWALRATDLLGKGLQAGITAAVDIGNWIMDKVNSVGNSAFVNAGQKFAGWVLDGLGKLATLVKDNWSTWICGAIIFTGTIGTAIGSFAWGIVKELGAKIAEKASNIWDGVVEYTSSVGQAARTFGANLIDDIGMAIAGGVNAAFEPITAFLNEIIRTSNTFLKTDFSEFQSPSVGTGNIYGTSGDTVGTGKQLGATIIQPVTDMINAYTPGYVNPNTVDYGASGMDPTLAQGFKATQNMLGFLTELGKQGKTWEEAKKAMLAMKFDVSYSTETQKSAWGSGRGQYLGAVTGNGSIPWDAQGVSWVEAANAAAGTPGTAGGATSAYGTGGILSLLNKGSGGGIVPANYSVQGAVTDGMKVFVTNWPAGFNGGGFEQLCAACGPQGVSVDYGYGTPEKFTGNITPGGPGIGMVGSASSTTPYANRLEVDTCEIDSFGMTPGLGAELARTGAWKPIKGAPVSEKLAAEIGYQGNYSNVGQTAMVGSIKQAYDRANKSQIQTQTKVNNLWTEGVGQASSQQLVTGQMVGQYQVQAANFGANVQNQSSASWYNATQAASNTWSGATTQASSSILASGTLAGTSINIAGNNLGSVLSGGSDRLNTSAANLTNATGGLTGSISSLQGLFDSQTGQMGTLLGSLNATALGLTSMSYAMGIPMGGQFVSGGSVGSGGGAFGGTSISGGGGWVGTGASATGWGAAASNAMRGYTGGVVNTSNFLAPYGGKGGGIASPSASYSYSAGAGIGAATSGGSRYGGATFSTSSVMKLGKYAEGGMVNKPQVAMIGEAGREAVLPTKLVDTIMRGVGGDQQMVHMTLNVDGKRLADVTGPAIIKRVQQGAGLKVR